MRKIVLYYGWVFVCCFIINSQNLCACTPDEVKTELDQAHAAFDKASNANSVWINTEDMIKMAEDLMQQGKLEQARDLAHEARYQAELSYAQSLQQPNGFPAYLR
ncbi:hypothetical protein TI04_01050 [Achromatium sp. WMS2]|nr:hypothetical protein TI04_01050 [Achromatium sp. WMS2]